ncbi:hypothetical protein K501DRAFT_306314 [Backusella circina FSU 941]|nr:hypothetical protein K501DRAFT_306314 [Backusella circina FSU 941]
MTPLVHIPVSVDMIDDKVALQLLNKLDKGAETITNLHSLLMTKTGELNQLVAQLELIQQVLTKVEYGTQQIENVLKEMGQGEKLLDAEASLDFAIQSANHLYNNDLNVLQKASVDLDIAKTIALSVKNECRRRSALLHNKNASKLVKQLGDSIRDDVRLFKTYSYDQPLLINGVNVLTILDREDVILTKNHAVICAYNSSIKKEPI